MQQDDLEALRKEMRMVTAEIMKDVKRRMEIAEKIGNIKKKLGLDIIDEKAEDELRTFIMNICNEIKLDDILASKLLNFLINESSKVQAKNSLSTPVSVFAKARKMENEGKKIIHLEVGEPDLDPPEEVKASVIDAIEKRHYRYTESAGLPQLRHAIAELHKVNSDQVIITPGGRFAVYLAVLTTLNAGEEIIIIEPAWPAYKECAELVNAKVRVLRTEFEDKWQPDLDNMERMINNNTRMIVINYPNNPTGKILDSEYIKRIVEIARDKKITLLSDEVYAAYSFTKFTSVLEFDNIENSIMVSSFSKGYGMTGFRIGYAIARREIIQKMSRLQGIALTSVAEPIQYAALGALRDEEHPKTNAQIMKRRISIITKRLSTLPVSFIEPDGGMYVFAKIKKEGFNADEFIDSMLQRGLALAPGNGFGNYPRFIRISAGKSEDVIEQGLNILEEALA